MNEPSHIHTQRNVLKTKLNLAISTAKITLGLNGMKIFALFLDSIMMDYLFGTLKSTRREVFTALLFASNGLRDAKKPGAANYLNAWTDAIFCEETDNGYPVEFGHTEKFIKYLDFFIAYAKAKAIADTIDKLAIEWLNTQSDSGSKGAFTILTALRALDGNIYMTKALDGPTPVESNTEALDNVRDFSLRLRKMSNQVFKDIGKSPQPLPTAMRNVHRHY